jgi:hypothetical protein
MKLPNFDSAFVDIEKLRNYSLNPNHTRGQHKARLFRAVLEMTVEDAQELQAAILAAVKLYDAVPGEQDAYGQRYTLDFPLSRLGKQATIRTSWMIRPTENFPRLTSCYVLKQRRSE